MLSRLALGTRNRTRFGRSSLDVPQQATACRHTSLLLHMCCRPGLCIGFLTSLTPSDSQLLLFSIQPLSFQSSFCYCFLDSSYPSHSWSSSLPPFRRHPPQHFFGSSVVCRSLRMSVSYHSVSYHPKQNHEKPAFPLITRFEIFQSSDSRGKLWVY
jgi:hypothetical protein